MRLKADVGWSLKKRMLNTLLRVFAGNPGGALGLLRSGRVEVRPAAPVPASQC